MVLYFSCQPQGHQQEYDWLVENKHPLVVNATAVKLLELGAPEGPDADKLTQMVASGKTINEMRAAFGVPIDPAPEKNPWIPVIPAGFDPIPNYKGHSITDRYPQLTTDAEIGQVLGPRFFWSDAKLDGNGVRADADVRVDGENVSSETNFAGCN